MAMNLALTQLFRLSTDIWKVTEPQALGWAGSHLCPLAKILRKEL